MDPIKLGIIGCGIATKQLHWQALQKLRHKFEVAIVCNHTEPKAREFAQMAGGVPYVLDYHKLLQHPEVEAVDITLPIHLNYQATKDALESGKHVFVEKPLAANVDDGKKLVEFARRFPQVKMVAENYRHNPVFHKVKEYLNRGIIGKPYAVFWDIFHLIDPRRNKYAQTQWRIKHEYPGGFVFDGGIHNIAALRLIFEDIVAGQAFTKSVNLMIGEMDSMSFQFATKNDVHGVFNFFASVQGMSKNELAILGKDGTLFLENQERIRITMNDKIQIDETVQTENGFVEEFEAFYEAVRKNGEVISTFSEACRDLEVMIGALESAKRWDELELNG
ncbi:Gfo/Idh/MocA family oxidoreductase [candidate division KSB1 bacterium]|nr:Gfo/Idh/MocA family oxidoreductase [candidate division KSB1 bacterium]NIS28358.1 Gfo/Idh/MocA family oxidoreductase [candidate division KSB1 bacterium]NIT75002.1 Gfo/Idh/MocA family oxidoreductase [candidate division KSB1 bacterium]NIU29091.1 Gfo/Idh/MocA family oxidoreductase [candidate division KSB1 bacterium]NIU94535.1 Gfo/Idh/MocA family oxidoreductase [candidate division KSB1 bacterium]